MKDYVLSAEKLSDNDIELTVDFCIADGSRTIIVRCEALGVELSVKQKAMPSTELAMDQARIVSAIVQELPDLAEQGQQEWEEEMREAN